jgi:hypothetical protein
MLVLLTTGARARSRPRAGPYFPAPARALYFPDFLAAFGVSSMIEYTFVL